MSDRLGPGLTALCCLFALGCIEESSTDDGDPSVRETGYLRCVAQTDECAPQLRCLPPEGGWECVDPPPCDALTCECAGAEICGDRTCQASADGDELICGDAPDAGAELACEDRPADACGGGDGSCEAYSGQPLSELPGTWCRDLDRRRVRGCAVGACGDAITYAAPPGSPTNCHEFTSTCTPAGWVGCEIEEVSGPCAGGADAALPPPPDAGPPGAGGQA